MNVQYRLDNAVHQEFVPENAREIEAIEGQQPGGGIEAAVGEHHGDVVGGKRRQMETGGFIAGIVLVEQKMKSRQTFVVVLRGEACAVVVIPESALRLVDIAVRLIAGAESGQRVGIVLVIVLPGGEIVARETVALRGCMPAVQVRGNRVDAKAAVV